ncbi:pyridoxal phosphate-dependent decarboxylase family protein [Micromonospora purpureochromogenes]|uniref:Glutamate/tyrosine decarboxylase-like PLP-dependent enzyme n=1 Tax=Micromonospora purpureochromogenes TaxID=47872 RepID=A0ABX2RHF3_9ACTN|nr:aminotransferase class V-fold PLP-dependent enzyme [Micromonospora purpureochromogenes]NYF55388.1 glutamate/tyrosine decarboxylase-like PLP-dependent enzyme [Micromonospora purpureochromogenes]
MIDEDGAPAERVLAEIRELRALDRPTHGGRLFAYVYDPAVPGLDELAAAAHAASAHVNGLDPTAFPSLLAMENALVGAAARLLGGGPGTTAAEVVGSVTSGGTESLILAVKAARDARPELTAPRIVVPASGHAAFAKAAHLLGVTLDTVPVDPKTLRPAAADVAAAIRPQTVLVACSAPSYAHGVIDPVAEIAAAAAAAGVRCHVDACFGGWTLPYLRRLGVPVPPFDFAVDGVTSISVDLHKYAYAPKGVSVLLHRDPALRAPQYFAYADWPGYTMVNPVLASTRSGGPIAAAYATLRHLGDAGYLRLAAATRDAVTALADAVRGVDGLRLMAEPESTVVCFTSTDPELDLFVLVDELTARGWHTQPQLRYADLPASVHLTVTASVAPRVAEFGPALADAVAAARAAGPVRLPAELAALATSLTPAVLTPELIAGLAAGLGLGAGAGPLPDRLAQVNTLLDAAPPALRERLLVEFVGLLQRPAWRLAADG